MPPSILHPFSLPLLSLAFAVALARWATRARLYYNWDSIQYALGTQAYDLRLHQPHPPGSAFYVFLARLLNGFTGDPHESLLLLSAAASGLTVLALFALGREAGGRRAGAWASLLGAGSPLVWFYGSVGLNYAVDGLFAALTALYCLRLWRGRRDPGTAILAGACLAAAGGFRPTTVIFLAPLWLVGLARLSRAAPLAALASAGAAGVVALAWALPTASAAGGFTAWVRVTRDMNHVLDATSVWRSSAPAAALVHAATTHRRSLEALLGAGWIALPLLALLAARRRSPASPCDDVPRISHGARHRLSPRLLAAFLALWIAPAALFYLLAHFNSPGYTLVYAPALLLGAALPLARWTEGWNVPARGSLAAVLLAANVAVFWWGLPWASPRRFGQRALSRAEIADHDGYWSALRRHLQRRYPGEPVRVLCTAASTEGLRVGEALLPDRSPEVYQVVRGLPLSLPPSLRDLPFLHFCTPAQIRTLRQPILGVWRTDDDRRYHRSTLTPSFGPPVTEPIGGRWRALVFGATTTPPGSRGSR